MELGKYIRDILQEGSVEKVLSKLKKALFDSFEALKELRDKVKLGQINVKDFHAQKSKIEKRIDSISNRILYIKQAKHRAPIIEEPAQKEAELLMNEYQVEKIVMMMINAIGQVEKRELELQKRVEAIEESVDLIKSFLLSKPTSFQGPISPPSQKAPTLQPRSSFATPPAPPTPRSSSGPPKAPPTSARPHPQSSPDRGPSEDDIAAFRKKLLKPAPKEKKADKPKPKPVSIRSALLQEMKEFFGTAKDAIEKEKEEPNETPLAKDAIEEEQEEADETSLVKDAIEEEQEEADETSLAKDAIEEEQEEADEIPLAKDAIEEEQEEPEIILEVDDSDTE